MTLKFTFFCKNANIDYFLGLLQKIAQNFGVESCVDFGVESLEFYASGENLGDFATALTNEIPLSLYFRFKNVEVCEKPTHLKPLQNAQSTENILSVSEINARKFLQDTALKDRLQDLCDYLKNGREIALNTSKGKIVLFTQKSDSQKCDNSRDLQGDSQKHDSQQKDFDFILANDISTLNLYTRASQDEINALATFEKPLIRLSIKEVFVKEVGAKNALFILPFDIDFRFIFSLLEVPFLFAKRTDSTDNFFEIVVGQRGYFLEKKFLDSRESKISNLSQFLDLNFASLCEARSDAKQSVGFVSKAKQASIKVDCHDSTQSVESHNDKNLFIAYISTANPTVLANLGDKIPHIKINFDKNPKNILAKISTLENGDKLIANFKREFGERYEAIQALNSAPQISENIKDIFECAAMILGASKSKSTNEPQNKRFIFQLAQSCLRDISPKVDFKNIKIDDSLHYDANLTIRSIISFTLAGTEREIIAYGLLESLVDYLVLIFRDAQNKNYIKSIGIIGDLFANKIFFDKITKKIPANFDLILPKYLDFKNCENIDSEG